MSIKRTLIYRSFIVSVLLLSMIAVFVPVSAEHARYGGTFIIGATGGEPSTLNPGLTTRSPTNYVACNIFESLVELDTSLRPQPCLAESWVVSADGKTITFSLVRNATWHDGEPFTSADVKFTFEEVIKVFHPGRKTYFGNITAVETPNDYTAVFRYEKPFAPVFTYLSLPNGPILPKHIYEGTDIQNNPANLEPIGTGAFKFEEWIRGSHIKMVRNDNYWREDLPHLDAVIFKYFADSASVNSALETGEVDYVPTHTHSYYESLAELEGIEAAITTCAYGYVYRMPVNLRHPILGDVRVRQAISHAIDRQALADTATYGFGVPNYGPINAQAEGQNWAYNPDAPTFPYNTAAANDLLDDAGYPRGTDGYRFEVNLYFQTSSTTQALADLIKDMLDEVGIKLTLSTFDFTTFVDKVYLSWDFDMSIQQQWSGPDPLYGDKLYTSKQIIPASFVNCFGYNNSVIDELYATAAATIDKEQRAELYYEIQDILHVDMPEIWLLAMKEFKPHSSDYTASKPGFMPHSIWGREGQKYVYWKLGTLPEEPEPPISEEITERLSDLESETDTRASAIEDSITDLQGTIEDSITDLQDAIDAIDVPTDVSGLSGKISSLQTTTYVGIGAAIIAILVAAYGFMTKK